MLYDPNLILTVDNRPDVIDYLVAHGRSPASVAIMTNVQLINAYHETAPRPTDIQRATAAAILATLANMGGGSIANKETVRRIARDEATKLFNDGITRKLEIVGPRGSITLEGIVHYRTELTIKIVALGHAVMLVGPAGCGKTTIGEHTAKALQLPFNITSTINETHELIGFVDGHGTYHRTPFRDAFERGGVWIADEIDAWDANALLAANAALANGFCNFPDKPEPIYRHTDFRMIATANTFGTGADRIYVGRNELDAASLDRFAVIDVDYDLTLERLFAAGRDEWLERIWSVRKAVDEKRIRHVVSSRAIAMGSAALGIGIEWDECEAIYLFKGMSSKDRAKIDDNDD
jgi:energy-coupling factor transporter ATP-binding protein EcfA2